MLRKKPSELLTELIRETQEELAISFLIKKKKAELASSQIHVTQI